MAASSPSSPPRATSSRATDPAPAHIFVRHRKAGTTERASLGQGGVQANGDSGSPAISASGRYVAFVSSATNLVAGDTNGAGDASSTTGDTAGPSA